jgi:predicted aconitase
MRLSDRDRAMLRGDRGTAAAMAMRILVEVGRGTGAEHLIDIDGAHVDGCLFHGQAGLDFAERLARGGARVCVPTTLNVSSLDLLHPALIHHDPETARSARRLMDAYVAMGCRPTWTCAPYQSPDRPGFGRHVAWAESNAIVFANSVLGARTDRYGDFIDVCAAIAGRVPFSGLHRDDDRRARVVFRVDGLPEKVLGDELTPALVGHIVGLETGRDVPAIVGLPPDTDEDRLKSLGAAAASSGAVAMFHAVGVTPEAPTLEAATGGSAPNREVIVTRDMLRAARGELSTAPDGSIGAVSVGTPHASLSELERLSTLWSGSLSRVPFYVNTSRAVLERAVRRGLVDVLRAANVTVVVDTCTYVTPILHDPAGPVMTNSAKWAWYAPANLGVDVVIGTLAECVHSAREGRVVRDDDRWTRG